MTRFSPNFNWVHLVPASIDPMDQICKFFKIQDGGGRHLEFRNTLIISAWMKRCSPNFNSIHLLPTSIDFLGQIGHFGKIQDGGGRHFEFRKKMKQFPH